MSVPHFDPWSVSKRLPTRAYRAYCAYLDPILGTSGTIGTGAQLNSVALQLDHVRAWERRLRAARLNFRGADDMVSFHEKLVISAIEFCCGPWAARLTSLGWRECDLFAVADDAGNFSGLIQFLDGRPIRFATRDTVYFGFGCQLSAVARPHSLSVASQRIWDLPSCR